MRRPRLRLLLTWRPRSHPCHARPRCYDYSRTTCSSGALPAPLLVSPSSYVRGTGTASTSAVTTSECHTSGTSNQSSSDDYAGEAGLLATDRQTHPVGHLGANLIAGTFLRPLHPRRFELASHHGIRVYCLDRQQHLGSCPLSYWLKRCQRQVDFQAQVQF
jgi:hypothetical protein